MSRKTRSVFSAVLILSILALGAFALDLLANFASAAVPRMFQEHPALLWGLIAVLVMILIGVNLINELSRDADSINAWNQMQANDSESHSHSTDLLLDKDAFISYSHKDLDFVERKLLPFLRQHSFTYCIDRESFQTGGTSIEEIERCVIHSKRVILVLTREYLESEWANFENILAQTLDPSARSRKLIPILVKTCNLPLRLRIYHYRDLRNDDKLQWDLLARDLA